MILDVYSTDNERLTESSVAKYSQASTSLLTSGPQFKRRTLHRTQISLKSKQEFPGLVNYTFFNYFPILSSKDDISFRLESGSAHVKFDRLNQQRKLIVWVDLNRYQVRHM